MQNHATPRRRWLRRTITAAVTGAVLLVPSAALARPAHANELPQGPAQAAPGLQRPTPPGFAYGRPSVEQPPPGDLTGPGIVLLDPVPTTIGSTEGSTALFRFDIADDSGQVAAAWLELSNGTTWSVDLTEQGSWEGVVYNDGTLLPGQLTWRVVAQDAAGNTSTVDGPAPLQVV